MTLPTLIHLEMAYYGTDAVALSLDADVIVRALNDSLKQSLIWAANGQSTASCIRREILIERTGDEEVAYKKDYSYSHIIHLFHSSPQPQQQQLFLTPVTILNTTFSSIRFALSIARHSPSPSSSQRLRSIQPHRKSTTCVRRCSYERTRPIYRVSP